MSTRADIETTARARSTGRAWLATAGLGLALCGCLDNDLPPDENAPAAKVFLAQQSDFDGFRDWMLFALDAKTHPAADGPVNTYLNRLPATGARAFPIGTMLVKTVEAGAPSAWTIHAMVKRGGEFNAGGARDWEFFELKINDDDVPVIVWRGEKPADGHKYKDLTGKMQTETDCNDCHESSKNDAVLTPQLDLKLLP